MDEPARPGLYVHVPFCQSKCPYCGFYSVAGDGDRERWLAAVTLEARHARDRWPEFDSCYLGGGTPSVLREALLERLVDALRRAFRFTDDAEWTLEVNPGDVTPARALAWHDLGFNRTSVGVQSFDPQELAWLGRRHGPETAREALGHLRAAGFEDLGIDLIQGLPGQTLEHRFASLDRALEFEPEHLSCYELTLEPGTPLAEQAKTARWELPDSDWAADAWLATSERVRRRGYVHYEVSNFAHGLVHMSRHNSKYWVGVPYLGLGPSAHSFSGRSRWHNLRSVADYCSAIESGTSPTAAEERLSDEQLRWERVSLGLRTMDGIALDDLVGTAPGSMLEELVDQGFLACVGQRLVPSLEGLLVADALARRLLFGGASPWGKPETQNGKSTRLGS
jgi:putative oxygen-independent coproporphyrinogen III oxidase